MYLYTLLRALSQKSLTRKFDSNLGLGIGLALGLWLGLALGFGWGSFAMAPVLRIHLLKHALFDMDVRNE